MAKIKLGALAHMVSGAIGSQVYSRNRYGAYVRSRTIPTLVDNQYTQQARGILGTLAEAWSTLTAAQRNAWATWAQTNPVIDRLGDRQVLTGIAAFVQLNARIARSGDTRIDDPPIADTPDPIMGMAVSADIGAGTFDVSWTSGDLPAGVRLWVWTALVDSASITYVRNLRRLTVVSDAAASSPLDIQAEVQSRHGTIQVGQTLHVGCQTVDGATGLASPIITGSAVVTESV
jgi:hypothetical protein